MLLKKIYQPLHRRIVIRGFEKQLENKYAKLKVKRPLSKQQKHEARRYWKELAGVRTPLIWHKFMYSRTGIFAKEYVPVGIYRTDFIGRMNSFAFMGAYADKNVLEMLFPEVKQPITIVKNMNGYYYLGAKPVTESEALEACANVADGIIKPSMGTRGEGVYAFNSKNGKTNMNGKTVAEVFKMYGQDFCVQEKIKQHPALSILNPTSVNTVRLLTYRRGMEILVFYTVIRIGKLNQVIDNESAGGLSARIEQDGRLAKYAFGAPGDDMVEKTDCGVTLLGYKVPSYDKVVETAKRLHYNLPYFNIAAWDFCVGEDGEPILIEWNANPDLSQSANGPAFGQYTDEVVRETLKRPNTRNKYW